MQVSNARFSGVLMLPAFLFKMFYMFRRKFLIKINMLRAQKLPMGTEKLPMGTEKLPMGTEGYSKGYL